MKICDKDNLLHPPVYRVKKVYRNAMFHRVRAQTTVLVRTRWPVIRNGVGTDVGISGPTPSNEWHGDCD